MTPLRLALLHLFRRPASTWIAVLSIALAVASAGVMIKLFFLSNERFETLADEGQALVGAKSGGIELLLGGLNLEGEYPAFIPYNLFLTLQAKATVRFEDGAASAPELEAVIPFLYFADYKDRRVLGTNEDFLKRPTSLDAHDLAQGRWVSDGAAELVVGADAAVRDGIKIGDILRLRSAAGASAKKREIERPFKVVGILSATGKIWDEALFSSVKDAQQELVDSGLAKITIWGEHVLNYFLIYVKPAAYPSLRSLINDRTVAQVIWIPDEIRKLRDLTGTGRGFGLLLMTLVLFLGGCSVATLMITRFESMSVQVAVLRALGYARNELARWMLWEGVILGGGACVIGGLLDAAIFPSIRRAAGLELTVVHGSLFLQTLIVWFAALLATILAVGVPLIRLSRQNVHISLKG